MTIYEFQELYPTKESKAEAAKGLTDAELDCLIDSAHNVQAKILYSRFKKKNQLVRYSGKYNEIARNVIRYFLRSGNENIVLSPFSIIVLLTIITDSVAGDTQQEILDVLGGDLSFEDYRKMLREFQSMLTESTSEDRNGHCYIRGGNVVSSNAVCVLNDILKSINPDYEERLGWYHGRLFGSDNLVEDVNSWVDEQTKGMIPQMLDEPLKDVMVCLLNAIAFEAQWEEQYDKYDVKSGKFNNADGSLSEVKMLHGTEGRFVNKVGFKGFIKPYKDREYSFMALLPDRRGPEALKKVLKSADFTDLFMTAGHGMIRTVMPEYNYDYDCDLSSLCMDLGMQTVFSPAADFSPMSSEWLKLEQILHKAHIEVDRNGTKAAAATAGILYFGSGIPINEIKEVRLDRPFVYAIMHNETGLPVFVGVVNKL